jgi:ElaB/YqjD/DUF883 family membrane-anchored ribosome-binding protein
MSVPPAKIKGGMSQFIHLAYYLRWEKAVLYGTVVKKIQGGTSNMEDNHMMENMAIRIEEMKAEIAALRIMLAEKREKSSDRSPEIRSMLEDGFAKVSDAIRPLAREAGRRIGRPARSVVTNIEEKIALHPLAAIMIALGAGLVAGKALDIAARPAGTENGDA